LRSRRAVSLGEQRVLIDDLRSGPARVCALRGLGRDARRRAPASSIENGQSVPADWPSFCGTAFAHRKPAAFVIENVTRASHRGKYRCRSAFARRHIEEDDMRRHHEEIAMLPALTLLLPFAGVLWLRIRTGSKKPRD
jgi:hypothetical protein